jgi:hypothetical protein
VDKSLQTFLKQCFFLPGGYLRPDLRQNLKFDASHGLIKFETYESTDVRWYLPFAVPPPKSKGKFCCIYNKISIYGGSHSVLMLCNLTDYSNCLFNRVSRILELAGIINPQKECIVLICLIIGGWDFQPVHFDTAVDDENKSDYKKAMQGKYAPASILLGFGTPVRLAIEASSVEKPTESVSGGTFNEGMCCVKGGIPDQQFHRIADVEVVQRAINDDEKTVTLQHKNMVVLQSDKGLKFRGDFCHAGAPSVHTSDEAITAWNRVLPLLKVDTYVKSEKHAKSNFEGILKKLMSVPNMDSITRLHVQVKPINSKFVIPSNKVGFPDHEENGEDEEDDEQTEDED